MKKILALFMALTMLLAVSPASLAEDAAAETAVPAEETVSAEKPAENTAAEAAALDDCEHNYENGYCTLCNGLEPAVLASDGVYEIGNAGQLRWFADKAGLNADARLVADIDYNPGKTLTGAISLPANEGIKVWQPLGMDETAAPDPYTGTFDGQGYAIKGLYIRSIGTNPTQGGHFSGFVAVNAGTIKDLTIVQSVSDGEFAVGGIAYKNTGTIQSCRFIGSTVYTKGTLPYIGYTGGITAENEGTISDCVVGGSSVKAEQDTVGGITGKNSGTVEKCVVSANVITNGNSSIGGGVAGGIAGESTGNISLCDVGGSYNMMMSVTVPNSFAGGIAGKQQGGAIKQCSTNYMTITAGNQYAGGMVAYCTDGAVIEDCTAYLNTIVETGASVAGGIVGYGVGITITKAAHQGGTVTAGTGIAGGVAGQLGGCSILHAYSWGGINCGKNLETDSSNTAQAYAGGIVGTAAGCTISNVYYNGTIRSDNPDSVWMGAIVGAAVSGTTLNRAYYRKDERGAADACTIDGRGVVQTGVGTNVLGTAAEEQAEPKSQGNSFMPGEVTWLLNNSTDAGDVWFQAIDNSQQHKAVPMFVNEGNESFVYSNKDHTLFSNYPFPDATLTMDDYRIGDTVPAPVVDCVNTQGERVFYTAPRAAGETEPAADAVWTVWTQNTALTAGDYWMKVEIAKGAADDGQIWNGATAFDGFTVTERDAELVINRVDYTVTKPAAGKTPAAPVTGTPHVEVTGYTWFELDPNDETQFVKVMGDGDKFEAGKKYGLVIDAAALDGYVFADTADLTVTVNGSSDLYGKSVQSSKLSMSCAQTFTVKNTATPPAGNTGNGGGSGSSSPKTGDSFPLEGAAAMGALALLGGAALMFFKRRSKKAEQ